MSFAAVVSSSRRARRATSGAAPAATYDLTMGQGTADSLGKVDLENGNTPPGGTWRYVFVRSDGNDSNSGLGGHIGDSGGAKATYAGGWSALRDGSADRLLLASGDAFTEVIGSAARNGASLTRPQLVSTYDKTDPTNISKYRIGARAVVGTAGAPGGMFVAGTNSNYTVFENLELRNDSGSSAIFNSLGGDQVRGNLWYNCKVTGWQWSFQGDGGGDPGNVGYRMQHIYFRRCVMDHAFEQGLYLWKVKYATVEYCVAFHCGWSGTDRNAGTNQPTILKHNFYFGTLTENVTFRHNISGHASSHGAQLRGGVIDASYNVFDSNPLQCLVGGGNDYDFFNPTGVPCRFLENVCVQGSDINTANPRGMGFEFQNTRYGGTDTINRNIAGYVNYTPSDASAWDAFRVSAALNQPSVMGGDGNIAWHWGSRSVATAISETAFPGQCSQQFTNTVLPNDTPAGSNTQTPPVAFPDPDRNVGTYAVANGYANNLALWDYMILHPEINWADLIGAYIKAGYGR